MTSLVETITSHGGTLDWATVARALEGTRPQSTSARKSLDNPALHAPRPALVLAALKAWPNTPEHVPTHEAFVQASAAIKAGLGARREEHYSTYEDWALAYDGNDAEYIRTVWDSIVDSEIGAEWVFAKARPCGFSDDADDDFAEAPTPAEVRAMNRAAPAAQSRSLKILTADELGEVPEPSDFVEGLLCDGQASVIFGDANVGKSFLVLDLAMHVSQGLTWHGRQVDRRGVLYIAGEGGGGMKRRIAAFRERHGAVETGKAALALILDAIDFRDKAAIESFITTVQAAGDRIGERVGWIIVDTLSRALAGGNENAPDDMGALVRGADRVRSATGVHLTFVHHSGKDDARGARGHSLLKAAIDTEIKVERRDGERGVVRATVTKQRDLEIGTGFSFKLATVELGTDRRGKPITSCVVEPASIKPILTDQEREATEILNTMLFDSSETTVPIAEWRKAVLSGDNVVTGQTPDTRGKQWQRIRDSLKNKGAIEVYGDQVGVRF
jgi:hypothetical protein